MSSMLSSATRCGSRATAAPIISISSASRRMASGAASQEETTTGTSTAMPPPQYSPHTSTPDVQDDATPAASTQFVAERQLLAKPFRIDAALATRLAERHHRRGEARTLRERLARLWAPGKDQFELGACTRTYLPFYLFQVTACSRIDARLRDGRTVQHLLRHRHDGLERRHLPMQVYASHRFPRAAIHALKSASDGWNRICASSNADTAQPHVTDQHDFQPFDKLTTAMIPTEMHSFAMLPTTAINHFVDPFILTRERRRAELFLQHRYGRRKVVETAIQTDTAFQEYRMHPAYLPCYVFEGRFMRDRLVTIVDGISGKVVGERAYNPQKVAAACVAATTAAGTAFWPLAVTAKSLAIWTFQWAAVPYLLTAAIAKSFPAIRGMLAERRNVMLEMAESTAVGEHRPMNDPTWWTDVPKAHKMYTDWQERASKQEEADQWNVYREYVKSMGVSASHTAPATSTTSMAEEGPEQVGQSFGYRHPDILGYYRALGLSGREAAATQDEIRAAFHALAVQYHPDKQLSAMEKESAASRFQLLSQAYAVLKNADTRDRYDREVERRT